MTCGASCSRVPAATPASGRVFDQLHGAGIRSNVWTPRRVHGGKGAVMATTVCALDLCRVCGKRVGDFDPDGYEAHDAQRGHFACRVRRQDDGTPVVRDVYGLDVKDYWGHTLGCVTIDDDAHCYIVTCAACDESTSKRAQHDAVAWVVEHEHGSVRVG